MRHVFVMIACVVLVGCKRGDSVPKTPPPDKSPAVTGEQVYRPTFTLHTGATSAGTGFFVAAPSGRVIAITAAHVLDPDDWESIQETAFTPISGGSAIRVGENPNYCGRTFDELPPHESGRYPVFDTSEDFAIWTAPVGQPKVLELAASEPKVNEWVWVAGAEGRKGFALYRAKVTKVKGGTVMMTQHDKFAPMGFSGGPVLTADGKVIANVIAADAKSGQMAGATAGTIRKRISSY